MPNQSTILHPKQAPVANHFRVFAGIAGRLLVKMRIRKRIRQMG